MTCPDCGRASSGTDVVARAGWCEVCFGRMSNERRAEWRAAQERRLQSEAAFDRRVDRYTRRQSGQRIAGRPIGKEMTAAEMRLPYTPVSTPTLHCYVCVDYYPMESF